MKILYLSFYFEPDLCAGSFRNTPLAKELAKQAKAKNIEVHVLTTQPNRYATFNKTGKKIEIQNNLIIKRINVPKHKSKFGDQIISFYSYYKGVLNEIKNDSYDLVFASSSRLFTAYLGYIISKRREIPLYLDIRDIFTDTMNDVLTVPIVKKPLLKVLKHIEKKVFCKAEHINIISGGFESYIRKFDVNRLSNYTHGIDDEFLDQFLNNHNDRDSYVITYAGNIGEGQGLHKIIPEAAYNLGDNYEFRIVGDGGKIQKLKDEIKALALNNVYLEKPISRDELKALYLESDFLFIHLNNYDAFRKVLPSKVFEMGAFDKPIIAGVAGFAKEFIETNLENTILFEPGNVNELVSKLKAYKYRKIKRVEFIDKFKRDNINKEMAASILSYI